jgi:metallo-beta-lactamase family protein
MSNVRRENRRRGDRGKKLVEPLFDRRDVTRVVDQTEAHHYHRDFEVLPGIRGRFHDAGHIMGSSVVEVRLTHDDQETTLVFSGDLGQYNSPILRNPETPEHADLVLMETTYGDRKHRNLEASLEEFGRGTGARAPGRRQCADSGFRRGPQPGDPVLPGQAL